MKIKELNYLAHYLSSLKLPKYFTFSMPPKQSFYTISSQVSNRQSVIHVFDCKVLDQVVVDTVFANTMQEFISYFHIRNNPPLVRCFQPCCKSHTVKTPAVRSLHHP
jgi:hypothetical protein